MATQNIAAVAKKTSVMIVDLTAPLDERPLFGIDVDKKFFPQVCAPAGLNKSATQNALCISSANRYSKLIGEEAKKMLSHELELLIRLYYFKRSPAPWVLPHPIDLFNSMYGDVLAKFTPEDSRHYVPARNMLGARFTALLGVTSYRMYSWTVHKEASPLIYRICAKLTEFDDPRAVLEKVGGQVLRLRGIDLEKAYPLPDPKNPPEPTKKGPRKGFRKNVELEESGVKAARKGGKK